MTNLTLSKYNIYVPENDCMLVYNSLSRQFGAVSMNEFLKYKNTLKSDSALNWLKYGFACEQETDEDCIAIEETNKYLFDSCLDLTILVSYDCNFRCVYCFDVFNGKNITSYTMENLILFVKKNLMHYTALHVEWFGGEPLMAKEAIYELSQIFRDFCQKASRLYYATITTNGSLLDLHTFYKLLSCNVRTYIITVDGPPKIHDSLRPSLSGMGTYKNIISNLINIHESVSKITFSIIIRMNITKDVFPLFMGHIQYLNQIFGKDRRFSFMFSPVYDWGGNTISGISDSLIFSLDDIYKILMKMDISLDFSANRYLLNQPICQYAKQNAYTIDPDGKILKCPQMNNLVFGELHNGKLELDRLKHALWLNLSSDFIERCSYCQNYSLCMGKVCPKNIYVYKENMQPSISYLCSRENLNYTSIIKLLYRFNRNIFINLEGQHV